MMPDYALWDSLQSPVWIFDIDCKRISWANKAALMFWNAETLDEISQRDFSKDMSEAVNVTLSQYQKRFDAGENIKTWWNLTPGNITRKVLCHFTGYLTPEGRTAMLVEVIADEPCLRRDIALADFTNLALLFDSDGKLVSVNHAFEEYFGNELRDLAAFATDTHLARRWLRSARSNGFFQAGARCWTGQNFQWFDVEGVWLGDRQQLLLHLSDLSDLGEGRDEMQLVRHHAEMDYLTGLVNRRGFGKVVHGENDKNRSYSLLFLDIDGFKLINDTHGHSVGDRLLTDIAERLKLTLDNRGLLARFGGDEFVIKIDRSQVGIPGDLARELIAELNRPFEIGDIGEIIMGCSIGIARYPEDADNLDTLITYADMALHRAKYLGRNRSLYFTPEMACALHRKARLRHRLSIALEKCEFSVHYQPITRSDDGMLKGFEALVRWNDEELGHVSPAEFIPLAEETGQIVQLGRWIMQQALKQLRTWRSKFGIDLMVSVNLSRAQLQPGLAPYVSELMKQYDIKPSQVALELTESTMLLDYDEARHCIEALGQIGVELYLDDFGTGYSSLSQLHDLPITTVKLDKSFVQGEHKGSLAVIEATRAICEKLGLRLIAEGIETQNQLEYLKHCGYDYCQGFYIGRPMAPEQLEELHANLFEQSVEN